MPAVAAVVVACLGAFGCEDRPAAAPVPTLEAALSDLAASPDEPPNGIREAADLWHLGRRDEAIERFLATRGEADRRLTSFDHQTIRALPELDRQVTAARIQLRVAATLGLLRELRRRADASDDAGDAALIRSAIDEALAAQRAMDEGMQRAFETFGD